MNYSVFYFYLTRSNTQFDGVDFFNNVAYKEVVNCICFTI